MTTAVARKSRPTVLAMLEQYRDQIARALPRHLGVDRMVRITMTEIRKTPALMKADPASLFGAVIQAAQLGLEPGINGQAYLVPFRNGRTGRVEVQFIPGYKGLMDLARRSGKVRKIVARVVREGDEFDYQLGTNEYIRHRPRSGPDAQLVAAYAVAVLEDGTEQIEVMTRDEIDRIRQRSKAANSGPWVTDYDEMARKTVVRRLCKYLPASVELAHAVALDEAAEAGLSQRNEALLDITPADAEAEEAEEEAEAAVPTPEVPAAERAARTEEVKRKLARKRSEPEPRTDDEASEAGEPAAEEEPATSSRSFDVVAADGAVFATVSTAGLWLESYRKAMSAASPTDRSAIARHNLGTLRAFAAAAAKRGGDAAQTFAHELEAAEALVGENSQQERML